MDKISVWTDGGARGNPGPAAIGAVIEIPPSAGRSEPTARRSPRGRKTYNEYIGETTNNVAEYRAVIFALKKVRQLVGRGKLKNLQVDVNVDSELIARQLRGEYKVLEKDLQPLFMEVWNLKFDIPNLAFKEIHREENQEADQLVNEALDKQAGRGGLF